MRAAVNAPVAPVAPQRAAAPVMETQADLKALAPKLNPVVGYWDPLGIGEDASMETIGWFRHAEIKHGRVAMAAFVGFCVQSNGICFPWAIQGGAFSDNTVMFSDISAAGGPAAQWDALSTGAKFQILGVIGFLEMYSETSTVLELCGEKHYVRGGKPGYYPKLTGGRFPHPVSRRASKPARLLGRFCAARRRRSALGIPLSS